jgi:hypothetical protein
MFVDNDEWVYKNQTGGGGGFGAQGGYDAIGQVVGLVAGSLIANQQAKKQRAMEKEIAERQLALQRELGLAQIKASVALEKQRMLTAPATYAGPATAGMIPTGGKNKTVLFVIAGIAVVGAIGFAVYKMRQA